MDVMLGFMVVVWFLKILAEDAYSTVKGQPNPRVARRAARQRHRSQNRVWGAFVNYLGDVAEDAREQAAEARQAKRQLQRREREQAEVESQIVDPAPRTEIVDVPIDAPKTTGPQEPDAPATPESSAEPNPAETTDEGDDARVIPLFRTKEDPTMSTTVTGEATGLISAMQHAGQMSRAYDQYAASGDQFVASLANGEVSGEAVGAAERAREFERLAAAEWARCYAELGKQLTVKEAYNATPGAGSKQFVTAE